MKITVIYGQNHKGSTYHIARTLAEKLNGEITEFFLPRDFHQFCTGCFACIMKDEKLCPHYEMLKPLTEAIDSADVLILASPVYVYHVTGSMKAWLDHYGYRWMIHRPEETVFQKQAVCISTAAGAGVKSTNKDMADSLFYWGVAKVYKYGLAVRAASYANVSEKLKAKIDRDTTNLAQKIIANYGHSQPSIKTKALFRVMRMVHKRGTTGVDGDYWKQQGWTEKARPWNS